MINKCISILLIVILLIGFSASTVTTAFANDFENGTIAPRGEVGGTPLIETPGSEGTIDVQYIPDLFKGIVKVLALGALADTILTENYTVFKNWLVGKPNKTGGEDNACSEVKINGHIFNHKDSANWVGDGRTNSYTRVYDLQSALREGGYNPGAADGFWGPNTKNAVKAMQSYEGMVVDGSVGPKTWAKIGVFDCAK